MLIGKLEQHCGECGVIEYCGNAFGFCLCSDMRFKFVDEDYYVKIAEKNPATEVLDECKNCKRSDCDSYRYSEDDYEDEPCEHEDESRDFRCKNTADFVWNHLQKELAFLISNKPEMVGAFIFKRGESEEND